jgi:hypothetical protein
MDLSVIPQQYHQFQLPGDLNREMNTLPPFMERYGFPVLDAFHMGQSCRHKEQQVKAQGGQFPPCLSDGMHVSRLMNTMLAQMILNFQCTATP